LARHKTKPPANGAGSRPHPTQLDLAVVGGEAKKEQKQQKEQNKLPP
jgi:hypothetical protein